MNPSQPVSSAIKGVDFGFLTTEDVRTISVKRITNPTTFDSLLHPVRGGLHDAALGAFLDNPCSTCNLTWMNGCPGHCGHIELPAPVYHVTFIDQLLRLLRGRCGYCQHFKLPRVQVNEYVCKLRLIRCGLVQEANDMHEHIDLTGGKNSKPADNDSDEGGEGIIGQRNDYVRKAMKNAGISKTNAHSLRCKTEAVSDARRQVIKQFYAEMSKSKKCRNCGGINPTYRKDRAIKIFRKNLSAKEKALMAQAEKRIQNPLDILAKREERGSKRQPHADEGVADLDPPTSEDDDDVDMLDAQEANGTLVAPETMITSSRRSEARPEPPENSQEYLTAVEVRAALVLLFERETEILRLVYNPYSRSKSQADISPDMFFFNCVVVPPNRYRMEDRTGDSIAESPKNSLYKNILNACDAMRQISNEMKGQENESGYRRRDFGDLQTAWVNLQGAVNALVDRDANPVQGLAGRINADGIKQNLEKKEGLFRKNMMGKRVNFAARSVISPDPNIETNEIGVPPVFAMKLTYPEPVTNHNFYDLKEAVLNGPDKWPGAVAIENEYGQVMNLRKKNFEERQALANQLLAPSSTSVNGSRNKKVHRHLNNGDIVIMNRQPTLHKPSMMAHRARVLPGEKTIRMHYANCNTYNADFDGDEMNMHFPQNEIARAEAATIADTDHQYLSATAGKPLRGLIQDHISMGVWLTNRDTFFTREEYQQLMYASLRPEDGHTTSGTLLTVSPAIWRPQPLWTGKQIITTVLKNIQPPEYPGVTLSSKSQTSFKMWGPDSEEQKVIIRDGDLLCGIMDKSQIGSAGGGLVNGIYETYGHTTAGRLLSVLGRLLTKLLHMRAFSCGVEDLILTKEGDQARLEELKEAEKAGFEVASKYVTLDVQKIDPNSRELRKRLEQVLRDESNQHGLDVLTNSATARISSAVTIACLPKKLIKPFPKNQMQTMTGSGAKGSIVNANQISCNLGQQVLEGRRVPVMVSGKTLPCFKPFETNVRAGGYVVNRFLTGIRPQEYYFHTMAGREGLIDTAVKTSRSGYLQRCIIKGMEGLRVEYDTSVRDSDGSMVQFLYGEDGLDTTKHKYLNDFRFQAENLMSLSQSLNLAEGFTEVWSERATEYTKSAYKKFRKTGDTTAMDPALAVYTPSRYAGSVSEKFYAAKRAYCENNPDKLIKKKKSDPNGEVLRRNFDRALDVKYLKSLVEPGEAVGVVAGQSIGEPSTQMTLNTFHLAGHSAKNVTLGIPRLREIVMTASSKISTPAMTLYPHPELSNEDNEKFVKSISRLSLSSVLDKVTITEKLGPGNHFAQARKYKIRLDFYPAKEYCEEYAIKVRDVAESLEKKFCPRLQKVVRTELKKKANQRSLSSASAANSAAVPTIGEAVGTTEQPTVRTTRAGNEGGNEDEESDDGDDEGDATYAKQRGNREESVEFDDPDDEEQAFAEGLRREDSPVISEDETYGSSPKPSRNSTPDPDTGAEEDDELLVALEEASAIRRERICKDCSDISDFKFDDKSGGYCEIEFEFTAFTAKLLMLHHVEYAADFATIHVIPGIKQALLSSEKNPDPLTGEDVDIPVVVTEGANLTAMREYPHIIDTSRLFTNDIVAMLNLYGVEACRATIIREMHAVFHGHSISVDNRHLNLIADTMTKGGGFTPFNRIGLKGNVSPFMKMSFETTVAFLRDAVLERDTEELKNPSARIVVGRLGTVGTGAFDVLAPVVVRDPLKAGVEVNPENTIDSAQEDVEMEVEKEVEVEVVEKSPKKKRKRDQKRGG
ncbi:beta and beta-prime subunits of DNA dependent RNA-polymerase [Lindgomyces ingoldianus]|uniref:Beta and beta-prime subunits of DNA dependent RNA-polymerase n=1 Tax=Lindgomyces ingoldianus TaxID=673940 RepID=A0ACB6RGA8_9PLEO|nr:beta and beta-prime subunits of DNA dependent RNA-polymerase [Lindgomyces ingoldianus]KAF2478246.1 beta and beta-prime subunits of DNA dependent RNA-polymerase [Lindgomyces ingoldianus]